jgi:hypothetical protein
MDAVIVAYTRHMGITMALRRFLLLERLLDRLESRGRRIGLGIVRALVIRHSIGHRGRLRMIIGNYLTPSSGVSYALDYQGNICP